MTELEHLTLLRKGASVAIKHGIHGDRQLAEALRIFSIHQPRALLTIGTDCDTQTAARLIKHLKNEGFLLREKNASKAGFKKTGKPMWYVTEDEEQRAKMLSMFFDPTTKIAHHVGPAFYHFSLRSQQLTIGCSLRFLVNFRIRSRPPNSPCLRETQH